MITSASTGLAWHKVTVSFDGQAVTIRQAGLGIRERKIPLSKITSVKFSAPVGGRGMIEFVAAGTDGVVRFPFWRARQFVALHDAVGAAL
jgi:hypothetical protein